MVTDNVNRVNGAKATREDWEATANWSYILAGRDVDRASMFTPLGETGHGLDGWLTPDSTQDVHAGGAEPEVVTDHAGMYLCPGYEGPAWWPGSAKSVDKFTAYRNVRGLTSAQAESALDLIQDPRDWTEFWDHPGLDKVRDAADQAVLSRWLVLGVLMAWVNCHILPDVYVGDGESTRRTPLNLFVAVVGPSGAGKGQAMDLVQERMVTRGPATSHQLPIETNTGSAEGMAQQISERTAELRREPRQDGEDENGADFNPPPTDQRGPVAPRAGKDRYDWYPSFLFRSDEITRLMGEKRGEHSTQDGYMLSMWSAEDLSRNLAKGRHPVLSHDYRACLVVGAQPGKVSGLMTETDSGLTQRYLFMPGNVRAEHVNRPGLEDVHVTPLVIPESVQNFTGAIPVDPDVSALARKKLVDMRSRDLGDVADDIGGQYTSSVLRVAVSLSIIMGETELRVTRKYWDLATQVLEVSEWTRAEVMDTQRRRERYENMERTLEYLENRDQVEEQRANEKQARLRRTIANAIDNGRLSAGQSYTQPQIRQCLASRDRKAPEAVDAVESLVLDGVLEPDPADSAKLRVASHAA